MLQIQPSPNGKLAREEAKRRKCLTCQKPIKEETILWCLNKGYDLPARCKPCKIAQSIE